MKNAIGADGSDPERRLVRRFECDRMEQEIWGLAYDRLLALVAGAEAKRRRPQQERGTTASAEPAGGLAQGA